MVGLTPAVSCIAAAGGRGRADALCRTLRVEAVPTLSSTTECQDEIRPLFVALHRPLASYSFFLLGCKKGSAASPIQCFFLIVTLYSVQ